MMWEQIDQVVERLEGGNNELDINFEVADVVALIMTMFEDDDEDTREPLVEDLLVVVGNHSREVGMNFKNKTDLAHVLLMCLWILATPDTFRSVALRFGVTPGVLHFQYKRMIQLLCGLAPTYIAWPSEHERAAIENQFEAETGFPNVVGAIDGTHIYLIQPHENPRRYINRHATHSILLQGVCDNTLLFRDIYVGEPGSLHDSRVFRRSPLSSMLLEDERLLTPEQHILGDGAYILTDKVLTPFRNCGNLTEQERWYNVCHASTRVCIERAFGLLKGKWRRLKYLYTKSMEYGVQHAVACVVLHNFLILEGEPLDRNLINDIQAELEGRVDVAQVNGVEHPNIVAEPDHPLLGAARNRGVEKRAHITTDLINRD